MKMYFLFAGICTGPSPGFSSRGGQKPEDGATFLKYSIGCMQQPVGQTWNGGPGTSVPPLGDGPAYVWSIYRKKRQKYACFMDDAL